MKEGYQATQPRDLIELNHAVNKHLKDKHLPEVPTVDQVLGSLPPVDQEFAWQTFEREPKDYFHLVRRIMAEKSLSTVTQDWYYAEGLMRSAREVTRFYDERLANEDERTHEVVKEATVSTIAAQLLPGGKEVAQGILKVADSASRFQEINRLLANRAVRTLRRLSAEPSQRELTQEAHREVVSRRYR